MTKCRGRAFECRSSKTFLARRVPQLLSGCLKFDSDMTTHQFQRILLWAVVVTNSFRFNAATFDQPDPREQMDGSPVCVRRPYTFKVKQEDSNGRSCWDIVTVISCWGHCSSNEIADWRFPFKRSLHPVCQHETTQPRVLTLKNCDAQTEPGTELYVILDAVTCHCEVCRSDVTNCEGPHYDQRTATRRLH